MATAALTESPEGAAPEWAIGRLEEALERARTEGGMRVERVVTLNLADAENLLRLATRASARTPEGADALRERLVGVLGDYAREVIRWNGREVPQPSAAAAAGQIEALFRSAAPSPAERAPEPGRG